VFSVRSGYGDGFGGGGSIWLVGLETGETREFVAVFDHPMPIVSHWHLGGTYSLGSKKNPISPLYTTGESLNSLASSGDSCIWA